MGSLILWSEYACDSLTLPETPEIGPHNRLVVGSIPTGPTNSRVHFEPRGDFVIAFELACAPDFRNDRQGRIESEAQANTDRRPARRTDGQGRLRVWRRRARRPPTTARPRPPAPPPPPPPPR